MKETLTFIRFVDEVEELLGLSLQFRVPVFVRVIQHAEASVSSLQLLLRRLEPAEYETHSIKSKLCDVTQLCFNFHTNITQ